MRTRMKNEKCIGLADVGGYSAEREKRATGSCEYVRVCVY